MASLCHEQSSVQHHAPHTSLCRSQCPDHRQHASTTQLRKLHPETPASPTSLKSAMPTPPLWTSLGPALPRPSHRLHLDRLRGSDRHRVPPHGPFRDSRPPPCTHYGHPQYLPSEPSATGSTHTYAPSLCSAPISLRDSPMPWTMHPDDYHTALIEATDRAGKDARRPDACPNAHSLTVQTWTARRSHADARRHFIAHMQDHLVLGIAYVRHLARCLLHYSAPS